MNAVKRFVRPLIVAFAGIALMASLIVLSAGEADAAPYCVTGSWNTKVTKDTQKHAGRKFYGKMTTYYRNCVGPEGKKFRAIGVAEFKTKKRVKCTKAKVRYVVVSVTISSAGQHRVRSIMIPCTKYTNGMRGTGPKLAYLPTPGGKISIKTSIQVFR